MNKRQKKKLFTGNYVVINNYLHNLKIGEVVKIEGYDIIKSYKRRKNLHVVNVECLSEGFNFELTQSLAVNSLRPQTRKELKNETC